MPRKNFWARNAVRSGFEGRIKKDLEERNIPFEYETLKIPYAKVVCPHCNEIIKKANYIPDFIIGSLICEAKGRFTSIDRAKHKAVRLLNPDLDIRILFQRDQKLSKASKTLYSEWCDKQGIIWAIGDSIPEEWLTDEITGRNKSTTKATKKRK